MSPTISITQLYFDAQKKIIEIPILKDIVPHLARSPGITGKALAKEVGERRSALSSGVQLLTGETLNELLKKWRLLHAMYLLSCTDLPYLDVAHQCGYRTITGLSKFLERNIKCTAREYREKRIHGNRSLK